jgi:bacterioferritin-associated ferredoxin
MQLHVNLPGYEDLFVELNEAGEILHHQLQVSMDTLALFQELLEKQGAKPALWQFSPDLNACAPVSPTTPCHQADRQRQRQLRSQALVRELILRAQKKWELPYQGEIVCTCREVSCESIDRAIVAGANSVESISAWTTACTSCTTCKGKLEELLRYRQS